MKPKKKAAPRRPDEDRRERFAHEYVIDLNGTQAAIRAGYSPNGAEVTASRLLRVPKVAALIEQLKKQIYDKKYGVTVERTLREISRLAFGDVRQLYDENGELKPIGSLDDDAAALVAGVDQEQIFEMVGSGKDRHQEQTGVVRKIKVRSKEKALSMAMAYLGMHKSVNPADAATGMVLTLRFADAKADRD